MFSKTYLVLKAMEMYKNELCLIIHTDLGLAGADQ